jgi:phage shock protein PspC (stress-responsive transcriptional regulator)
MTDEPREPETPTEPQPEPEPEPRRLTRASGDTVIGGVAGGLGRYFGVDPILFRIGFVALTFVGGVGIIAYLALLAFVPSDDPGGASTGSRVVAIGGAVVLGIAVVIFLDATPFFFGPGLLFFAVVAVAAVLLWRALDRDGGGRDPARTLARIALFGLLAFVVVCLAIGVGIAAALGGGVAIAALAVAAGLALIGAAFFGGARWLILPALVLVLPLAVVAAADIDLDGGVGDREYRPASVSQLQDRYEIGVGFMDIDLRDLDLPAGRTDVAVDIGVGGARVWVPSDACVSSDVTIGAGGMDVLDREQGGLDLDFAEAAAVTGRPELYIDADIGVGPIEIVREGFAPDWLDEGRGRFRRDRFFDDPEGDEPVAPREAETNCA